MRSDSVITEVNDLVSRGYKEVVFSGIHLGTYGRDLSPRTTLYDLLRRVLDEITGLERLRLSSIEPLEVVPHLIDLVAEHPRMAHHFHIPLQSGSNRILRAMYRPYTREYYSDLMLRVRRRVPDAAIGADVMVGFPGETDQDFMDTYRLIEESSLTYLHIFPFSSRPGTIAADLSNRVPDHVSRFRAKALRNLIDAKNEEFRRGLLGRELEVLTLDDGTGVSNNFVRVSLPAGYPTNEWVRVFVTAVEPKGLQAAAVPGC